MVDGFRIIRSIHASSENRLFLARDGQAQVVLKFPGRGEKLSTADRVRFIREAFIGQRVSNPYVGNVLRLEEDRQSCLYLAMPFYEGETLECRIAKRLLSVDEAIRIATGAGRGLAALHRQHVIHRDIKPGNIILLADGGGVKLIDLGVARLLKIEETTEAETPGTATFMAPELFKGGRGDEFSDQFALAVTLYRGLSGFYPFGDPVPGAHPLFGPVPPASRHRPEVPAWIDAVLLRALSLEPHDRFGDVLEFVHEMETGERGTSPAQKSFPLVTRNPALGWQLLSAFLLAMLLVAMWKR